MYRNPDYKFIDFKIFFSYLGLVLLGLYAIFVVEYDPSVPFSFYSEFGKQIIFHLELYLSRVPEEFHIQNCA